MFKRVGFLVLVLFGAFVIMFFLTNSIPGDPARAALGQDASEADVERYRAELGLDQPLYVQFWRNLKRLAGGNLGISITSRRPVSMDLKQLLPATIELVIPSLILAGGLGVLLGAISAVKAGSVSDHSSRFISLLGMSMPVFWLGLALQLIFYRYLRLLPVGARLPAGLTAPTTVTGFYILDSIFMGNWQLAWISMKHLVLPVITLSTWNLALMSRLTRAVMLEVLRTDYVRTARSKGLPNRIVIYRHALRNAMIPLVTVFGLRVGSALGGAVITETVFAWPGVGRYAVQAIGHQDYPVILGFTLLMCLSYALANLVVDVSYFYLDPRIKYV